METGTTWGSVARVALPFLDVSDTTSDLPQGGPGAPPVTEEQAREYMKRLRSAPVEQLVSELLSSLLNAAQVKLGRKDARLLIDLSGLLLEHARRHLSADLTKQVDQILAQLRLGQVRAESANGGAASEPNDLAETPVPPAGTTNQPPAAQPAPAGSSASSRSGSGTGPSSAASRLWLPGRDF